MAKQEQILIIKPQHELKFTGPFTFPVTSYMTLKNPSNHKVCFKIKTTAPKKYCVRPNSGTLNPNDTASIAVSLQRFEFDPNEKNKHKFMVQTMIAPDGDFDFDTLWKDVTAENLMDSKLKCVFEMPVGEKTASTEGQEANNTSEEKTRFSNVGEAPNATHDGELVKAAKEVKHLREEESSLRQENLQLKEELMRLRTANYVSSPPSDPVPPLRIQGQIPFTLLLSLAVIMAILGVIIGKYIL